MIVFYQLRNIVFVYICDFGENQIKYHDQFMQKTRKWIIVHLFFLATVYDVSLATFVTENNQLCHVVNDVIANRLS